MRQLVSCSALLGASLLASAQTVAPSQVTPPSLRPAVPQAAPNELVLPQAPEGRDGNADAQGSLDVLLAHVDVEGGFAALAQDTNRQLTKLDGRRVTVRDIRRVADEIEEAYRRRGYFLVRVTLPPQRLRDGGTLRLVVLDGFIEQIDASGVPQRVRDAVLRTLHPLVGRRGLKLEEAERRLRVASGLAGLGLRTALAAGEQPGASRLLLEGQLRDATVGLTVENGLAPSLGTTELLLSLSLNSPFGRGERLYLALGTARELDGWTTGDAPLALAATGLVYPVGVEGWTLNPEYTQTTLNPAPAAGGLRMRGFLSRSALRLTSPMATVADMAGNAQLTLEHVQQRQRAQDFGLDVSNDRYQALRAELNGTVGLNPSGGALSAWAQWSKGLGGRRPDPLLPADPALSRQGASPHFSHVDALLHLSQPLGGRLQASLVATGQLAFGHPMLASEQFALSGPDKVSGRPAGDIVVDEGATLRGELSWSLPPALGSGPAALVASPYTFIAAGSGRLIQPTAVEQASVSARSSGVGLRSATLGSSGKQAQFAAELARRWGAPGDTGRQWRLSLRLSVFM